MQGLWVGMAAYQALPLRRNTALPPAVGKQIGAFLNINIQIKVGSQNTQEVTMQKYIYIPGFVSRVILAPLPYQKEPTFVWKLKKYKHKANAKNQLLPMSFAQAPHFVI